MTTSVFGDTYYYYFYDWKIMKQQTTCPSDLTPVNVTVTSVIDLDNLYDITFMPNPVVNELLIDMNKFHVSDLKMEIYNTAGQLIFQEIISNSGRFKVYVDCGSWANGNYSLKLYDDHINYNANFIKM